jgi:aspartyl-tRNA(Asn)/glutamyl-tRNA(Gln) amidotransferase subunit C
MKLTKDQVKHLAHLARLHLTDEEIEQFAGELTTILDYIDMIQELDLKDVKPTSQVTGLSNVSRPDEIDPNLEKQDELLECSPLPVKDHQIRIKRMM